MICFQNSGELDPAMFQTFGVNVKPNASPIGFFGTGLKYAIATVLRLGGKITILSGITRYTFRVEPVMIRGKDFQQPVYSEQQWIGNSWAGRVVWHRLPFTLELGRHWAPWMAYRELWSNTYDEDDPLILQPERVRVFPGSTQVLVELEDFETIYHHPEQYFLDKTREPLYADEDLEIYEGASPCIFYRGIRVHDFGDANSQFTYNFTRGIALTEDRQISSLWEVKYHLIRSLGKCQDPQILRTIMSSGPGWFEHELNWEYFASNSKAIEVAKEIREDKSLRPSQSLMSWTASAAPLPRARPPALILDSERQIVLDQAKARVVGFLNAPLGVPVIVCSDTPDDWIIGGTIYIPAHLLDDPRMLFVFLMQRALEVALEPKEISEFLATQLYDRVIGG
jgi:hypothetical protein